jgi:hypothetical protein
MHKIHVDKWCEKRFVFIKLQQNQHLISIRKQPPFVQIYLSFFVTRMNATAFTFDCPLQTSLLVFATVKESMKFVPGNYLPKDNCVSSFEKPTV